MSIEGIFSKSEYRYKKLRQLIKLPEIFHFLADRKIAVLRVERREPTLEDLFMEVIGK